MPIQSVGSVWTSAWWIVAQMFGVRYSRTVMIVLWMVEQNEGSEGHEGCYK